jgi:tetratricopeptide (TPR) repeat protein
MSQSVQIKIAFCIFLALLTCGVYWNVLGNDFINYDDILYVTDNYHVTSGLSTANVIWAFTSDYASNWHPITWLSHMLDVELFSLNPRGHHLVNMLLHSANACLLFLVLVSFSEATFRSALVSVLFAIHPLHVESVAWIAERKDLLSTSFGFLALLAYICYVRKGGKLRYGTLCGCYALSLMSKPMLVTLPLVLLLLDYWPLRRFGKAHEGRGEGKTSIAAEQYPVTQLFVEKIPLFTLAALSSWITIHAQRDAINSFVNTPLLLRITNFPIAYMRYLGKAIWPQDFAIIYPLPDSIPLQQGMLAGAVLLLISSGAIMAARWHPCFLVGWLWFLATLVPVIGIVQVGLQSMADRYTYFPLIGIFIIAAWGGADLVARWPLWRIPLLIGAVGVIVVYSAATCRYVKSWKNSTSLFTHAIAVTTDNSYAQFMLGNALHKDHKYPDALAHYARALQLRPRFTEVHTNMGVIYAEQGDVSAAIYHFQSALILEPRSKDAHFNLAVALQNQGKTEDAIFQYREVMLIDPFDISSLNNMGVALMSLKRYDEATIYFTEVLRLNPSFEQARLNLQMCREQNGSH